MKNDGRDRDDGEETNELSFVLMRVMFVETQVFFFTLVMLMMMLMVVVVVMMMMKWKLGRWS